MYIESSLMHIGVPSVDARPYTINVHEKYDLLTKIMLSLSFFHLVIPILLCISLKCFCYLSILYFFIKMSILARGYSFDSALRPVGHGSVMAHTVTGFMFVARIA